MELLALYAEAPDNVLDVNTPPRENDPRVEALGDVRLEFKCDVDHRENPV